MKLIAIEEHFLTAEIRAAWASSAIGQEGTGGFDRGEIEERLDDLGQGRIALMDESGVDVQVLSVTTPALHNLEPEQSLILARRTNDLVAAGFGDSVDTAFATFALGWHYEAGIQFVRLVLAGVFDKYPGLRIILGHWGEVILFYLERLNSFARVAQLRRPVAEYVRENLYVTSSGMWSQSYLQRTFELVGPERILFSTDYPYQYRPGRAGLSFLKEAALSPEEKELFSHGNWERLMQ